MGFPVTADSKEFVLVNGVPVIADGKMTTALPRKVLYGPGYDKAVLTVHWKTKRRGPERVLGNSESRKSRSTGLPEK